MPRWLKPAANIDHLKNHDGYNLIQLISAQPPRASVRLVNYLLSACVAKWKMDVMAIDPAGRIPLLDLSRHIGAHRFRFSCFGQLLSAQQKRIDLAIVDGETGATPLHFIFAMGCAPARSLRSIMSTLIHRPRLLSQFDLYSCNKAGETLQTLCAKQCASAYSADWWWGWGHSRHGQQGCHHLPGELEQAWQLERMPVYREQLSSQLIPDLANIVLEYMVGEKASNKKQSAIAADADGAASAPEEETKSQSAWNSMMDIGWD
jgi:hypothetical protein